MAIVRGKKKFRRHIWNHTMNINKVKHDKCDWAKASGRHLKPRAGILLEVDLSVRPESYYYYYITLFTAWYKRFMFMSSHLLT